jgi:DNA mismatch endonuclease, patch repair protein
VVDNLSAQQRSYCMSRIRDRDTLPEIIVRRLLHRLGFRFRLHRRELPGCPDIVLPRHRKTVFVHGCFWHSHRCRMGRVVPKSNQRYWAERRSKNKVRDRRNVRRLRGQGWSVFTVWECWTRQPDLLERRLKAFLAE